jgi:hypothetical protein
MATALSAVSNSGPFDPLRLCRYRDGCLEGQGADSRKGTPVPAPNPDGPSLAAPATVPLALSGPVFVALQSTGNPRFTSGSAAPILGIRKPVRHGQLVTAEASPPGHQHGIYEVRMQDMLPARHSARSALSRRGLTGGQSYSPNTET